MKTVRCAVIGFWTAVMVAGLRPAALAALVGASGYTNDFSTQPPVADWSTYSISGASGDIATAAALDAAVQAVAASSITFQLGADAGNPPSANANASWSSTGFYVQTRPTGNGATLLMCSLVNNLGVEAIAVTISYNQLQTDAVTEEVPAHRAYYSLTGAAGSWTPIPQFSSAADGRLSVTLNFTWPDGGRLYLLWADDNGSGTPDTSVRIDNFSVVLTPGTQQPVAITNQPQSLIVGEWEPASFSVGVRGYPPPSLQWYTNGVPIPGATNATYSIAETPLAFNGLQFWVVAQNTVSNVTYAVTSAVATLTVNADLVPPVLLWAASAGLDRIVVVFSERLDPTTATNLDNYRVTGPGGSLIISNAVLESAQTNVTLTVSPMTPGQTYTLTVNGVADRAAAANPVAPNSQVQFTALSYTPVDIGNPALAGSGSIVHNTFWVSGAGTNIAGAADQFFFYYQPVPGNFDLKTRVASLSVVDLWTKAGLMARETLTANSRFAMAVATPSAAGTYFLSRSVVGANPVAAGSFPVNYPSTWLRLTRSNTVFTGYASLDGQTWVQLGSVTLTNPAATFYVGFALTSTDPTRLATAQFEDFGPTVGGSIASWVELPWEPLGPATRNTGLVISEIMYHPKHSNDLEFVEIFNAGLIAEDLSGYRLTGDIEYTFPPGTVLPAGGFLVVARKPALLEAAYGLSGVLGPWGRTQVVCSNDVCVTNLVNDALPDGAGRIQLRHRNLGAVLFEVNYRARPPWPLAADGAGHSLVLARPSYGPANPKAWAASDKIGGSPGRMETIEFEPLRNVLINEFMANTDPPLEDYIELYNYGTTPVDLFGAWLSDDRDTNKFRINTHLILPPRGFAVFTESQLGFALDSGGERIYLVNSNQTRVLQAIAFEAQAPGVATGRYPDGAPEFHELVSPTPGTTNSPLLIRDIVINEIMFHPISGDDDDQYVELYNRGTNAVDLSNWRFTDGIDYTFPTNTLVPPHGYLVVARNKARLLSKYPQLNNANTVGNFGGRLSHAGERLALSMPEYITTTNAHGQVSITTHWIVVDEVTYLDETRWSQWADGGGSSLELIDPNSDNRLMANWADSDETAKAPWTNIVYWDWLDWSYPRTGAGGQLINQVQVMLLGRGEALVDDIEVRAGVEPMAGPNLVLNSTFDTGLTGWLIQGNHVRSGLEPVGPNNPSPCLHIRATAGGDNGANRALCNFSAAIPNSTAPNYPNVTNATLTARARWLAGHRDLLLRTHGGGLEVVVTLPVPENLGTPGLPNSRLVPNAPPAIYDVTHSPVLPAANQPVVVTARVSDPDGIASVQLQYRLDPSTSLTTVAMRDDGTGGDAVAGDGLFSATIPGQASGTLVAFRIQATDAHPSPSSRLFPPVAPAQECLVRFGDPQPFGSLGVYRMWMKSTNASSSGVFAREGLSNEPVDGTFVYNNYRVIYNAGLRFRGSPFIRPNWHDPIGSGGVAHAYVWTLPPDDLFLGTDELNLDSGEHGGRDVTLLREPTAFHLGELMGLSVSYQRFIHLIVNGVPEYNRGYPVFLDVQQPNADYIDCWFADANEGDLFKIDDWFEFNSSVNSVTMQENKCANLGNFMAKSGGKKLARYRWCWEKKALHGLNDDYTPLFGLDNAMNSTGPAYIPAIESAWDIDNFITVLAHGHVVGDWDRYGYNRGKNAFIYRPYRGKFSMLLWDLDFALGCSGGHGPSQSLFTLSLDGPTGQNDMPEMNVFYNNPHFRRKYLQACLALADGPLQDWAYGPVLAARNRALRENGISFTSPYVPSGAQSLSIPDWITQRRTYIYQQVASFTNLAFSLTSPTTVTTTSNLVTISGNAPLQVSTIRINGREYPITWTSVTAWSIRVPLEPGTQSLTVQAYDQAGRPWPGTAPVVTATFNGTLADPTNAIVFSEIMFAPKVPNAEYVELWNRSDTAFDLSGWRVNGLDYTFPTGSVFLPRSQLVLVKDASVCLAAYGTNLPIFGQFAGNLQANGETLTLLRPGAAPSEELVVDKVRYEGTLPWNTNAVASGSALQLVDATQDNSRPCNWFSGFVPARWTDPVFFPGATNTGWRYVQVTGTLQSNANFYIWFQGGGLQETYLDDIKLVLGTDPDAGPNLLQNGDFESELSGPWTFVGTNLLDSHISTEVARSGNASLHVVSTGSGNQNRAIMQALPPRPTNATATLCYWFLTSTNGTNLVVRTYPGSYLNATTNVQPEIIPPSYTPPRLISPATNYLSPGAPNVVVGSLPPIPPLWLNEAQPENVSGPTDATGQRGPWIELYNAGPNVESLDGLYLANNYTNLLQWAFPPGATIAPGEFKVIFADGHPERSTLAELHTSFTLSPGTGAVALVRLAGNDAQVLDYLTYRGLMPDWSYGPLPDGQLFDRRVFTAATPGAPNAAPPVTVVINEWMAANANPGGYQDPADGDYDDWFELYNPTDEPVVISGLYLTDNLANKTQWEIPPGHVIPPFGFKLVWADNEPNQNVPGANGDLHVPFRLNRDGEAIGLFARVGTNIVQIDAVTFGFQYDNISEGRYPDASARRYFMRQFTPGAPNLPGNSAPSIAPIPTQTVAAGQTLSFTIPATDEQAPPQMLGFALLGAVPEGAALHPVTGLFQWTPTPAQAPSTNQFTVLVWDNGVPSLTATQRFVVIVTEPLAPRVSIRPPSANGELTLSFDTIPGRHYRVEYKDDLNEPAWRVLQDDMVATGYSLALTININHAPSPQRFFRIVRLD